MKENHLELIEKCQAIASRLQCVFKHDSDHWGFSGTLTGIAPYPILVSMAKTGERVDMASNRFIFHAHLKMVFSYKGEHFQLFDGDCLSRREYEGNNKISVAASRPVEQISHEILSRLMRPLAHVWPKMEKVRDTRLAIYQRIDATEQEMTEKLKAVGITATSANCQRGRGDQMLYCRELNHAIQVMDGQVVLDLRNICLTPDSAASIAQIILLDTALRSSNTANA